MECPAMIRLTPGRWIALPGTGVEVYLRGKYREDGPAEVVHQRRHEGTETYYWDLTVVYPRLYVRGVDLAGHPATYEEAIRPPIANS